MFTYIQLVIFPYLIFKIKKMYLEVYIKIW